VKYEPHRGGVDGVVLLFGNLMASFVEFCRVSHLRILFFTLILSLVLDVLVSTVDGSVRKFRYSGNRALTFGNFDWNYTKLWKVTRKVKG
jgi:hypothetical protein